MWSIPKVKVSLPATALREEQSVVAALTERVSAMQRKEVERLAENRLAVPSDLFDVGGVLLADLLDDAGDVDQGKVTAAVGELLSTRPGLHFVRSPTFDGGTRQPVTIQSARWSDVLNPRNQRR